MTDPADVNDFEIVFDTHAQPVPAELSPAGHIPLANEESTVRSTDGSPFLEATLTLCHVSKTAMTTTIRTTLDTRRKFLERKRRSAQ